MIKRITLPVTDEVIDGLNAGDTVYLSGTIYTARDAAHKRMAEEFGRTGRLPVDLRGQGVYYLGPAPAGPGQVIGPAGPTTSYRMDRHTPLLLDQGLKVMIGKGKRSPEVIEEIVSHHAVYFAATGGAAALLAKCITGCEVIAYDDLGPEAVRKLTLEDLPVTVAVDCRGNDIYVKGPAEYRKKAGIND